MAIEDKISNIHDELSRQKAWARIERDVAFKYDFLEKEMYRTVNDEVYAKMLNSFKNDPKNLVDWYFGKSLNFGNPAKSPYELCLEKDYEELLDYFGRLEWGIYV
jgi:hypothetical protein